MLTYREVREMETTPSQQSAAALPVPQVSNFCIILHKDGQVDRFADQTLEEYVGIVKDANIAWIDWTTDEQEKAFESVAQASGFVKILMAKLFGGFYSAYEDYETELGIMLPAVAMKNDTMKVHRLVILIRDNVFLTIHGTEVNRLLRFSRYAPPFFKRMSADNTADQLTILLERLIDENNDRNFEYFREI
jgi:magnesium transporter